MQGPNHLVRKSAHRPFSAFIGLGLALALVCLAACTGTARFEQNPTSGSPTAIIGGGTPGTPPPPTVTSISTPSGPSNGGTVITISGSNFVTGSMVSVGGKAATSVTVLSTASIGATVPPHPPGPTDVTVTNPDGQTGTLLSAFNYIADPVPIVNLVAPNFGVSSGGTTIFITGSNFVNGATVLVGGNIATQVTLSSSTQLQAVTPPGPVGTADVRVQNLDSQVGILSSSFTYTQGPAPTLTSVTPSSGPASGGTVVTLAGTNFLTGASVRFGGVAATSVTVSSPTQLSATTPAHAPGVVDVVIINPDNQTATRTSAFNFLPGPTVTNVSPGSGPTTGGTTVTVTGTNFQNGSMAFFGTIAAASTTVNSATRITAVTPASAAGTVDVSVRNPDGQIGTLVGSFVFTASAAPTLTSVAPTSGPTAGGTTVTLTGTNFVSGAVVLFGTVSSSSVTLVSSTQIRAVAPASAGGNTTITVINPDGQSATLSSAFNYLAPPSITTLSPNSGPASGGTLVSINGSDFQTGATVTFGGIAATSVMVASPSQILATTSAHAAGVVDVVVGNPDTQTTTATSAFTFQAAPTVTNVAPNTGSSAGGTSVTITGTNFQSGAAVLFGPNLATSVVVGSATTITAVTPAGTPGAVDVRVTNPDAQFGVLTGGFTYQPLPAPVVMGVTPNSGPTAGNTLITVSGSNFVSGATVRVGGNLATNVTFVSSTQLTARTPAGTAGGATVQVTNPDTQSSSLANGFTYVPPPAPTSIAPNRGPITGGTFITITGTNFQSGATATVGGTAATSVNFVSATTLTALTPAHAAGVANVVVTNPDGQSGTGVGGFTYDPPPTVTMIVPNSGTDAGLDAVTVTGTGFQPGAVVFFDLALASSIVVNSNTITITAMTPPHAAGAVNVTVRNLDGQQGTLAGAFTYVQPTPGPTVTAVNPPTGPTSGGTLVTINGANFQSTLPGPTGPTAWFGGTMATTTTFVNANQVTAMTPVQIAGTVDVSVRNPDGKTGTLPNSFMFVPPPTVSTVSPNSGPAVGGTLVTITGSGFQAAPTPSPTVLFGGNPATSASVAVVSATQITARTPAGAGTVNVQVMNTDGQSGTLTGGFTYVPPPTITSFAPTSGPTAGGTQVTITGTGYQNSATVLFGATMATSVTFVNSTQIRAVSPTGSGAVALTVRNPDNQQVASATNFTFVPPPPPTVSSVNPNSGPLTGNTSIAINGANFVSGATVTFSGTAAISVTFVNATQLTATTPARATAGAVNVVVTNPDTQSGTLTNGFTYIGPPTVTTIAPNAGPVPGGTNVTITGTGFQTGATVTIGTNAAASVIVVNSTQITAITPTGTAGLANVTVRNADTQTGTLTNGFMFVPPPSVTSVVPNSGFAMGSTLVTVNGSAFQSGATVTFGGTAATVVSGNSTQLMVTTPAHAIGMVIVQVRNPNPDNQSGALANGYTYVLDPAPVVTSVVANSGPAAGNTSVTVFGSNFQTGATVLFGGATGTITGITSTQIAVRTPAHAAGLVDVQVRNPDGQSGTLTGSFTFNAAPTVSSVSPSSGPTSGGTSATIMGAGFQMGASVFFGSALSSSVTFNSSTQVSAVSPPNSTGAVNVQVRNPDAQFGTLTNGFTYVSPLPAPTVTTVSPNTGPSTGATPIMITGTNFISGATVTIGVTPATAVVFVSATLITAVTPVGTAGAVNVVVTNPDGQMGTLVGGFTYTITSLPGQIIPALPTLPAEVSACPGNDCVMPDTTGYIIKTVCTPSGCDYTNLQTALTNEACGAGKIIQIQAGQTFTGNFSIPAKTCNTGKWFIVRTNAFASLPPPGTRVAPADIVNMPTLRCSTTGAPCLSVNNTSKRVRVIGLFITVPVSGSFDQTAAMVDLGDAGDLGQNTISKIPNEIVIDRVVIDGGSDGDSTKAVARGVGMHCSNCALVDSYIDDIHRVGSDTQAAGGFNSNGPILIQNNYLEASTENILFGGAGPAVPNAWPKDITIRRNYFFKPITWKLGDPSYAGIHWTVKNLLELKAASRVLIEGNVFENNWDDAQNGMPVLFNDCTSGSNIGISVDNVTFRYNKIINTEGGFTVAGHDGCQDGGANGGTFLIDIHDNVFDRIGGTGNGWYSLLSGANATSGGTESTSIRHNTMIMSGGSAASVFAFIWFPAGTPWTKLAFHDNIFGTGASTSNQNFNILDPSCGANCYTANSWFRNLVYRTSPTSTFCPTTFSRFVPWGTNKAACVVDIGNVGFVNLASGNFRLASGSPGKNTASDGRDVGADIDAIETATAGVKP